jgi:hypothetical protein
MSEPDDTPTRLQRIAENLATDYYIGTFKHTDDIHFLLAEVSRLREALHQALELLHSPDKWMKWCDHNVLERCELAEADVSRLQQENAALKADIQQIIDDREVNNESMAAHIRELEDELKNT